MALLLAAGRSLFSRWAWCAAVGLETARHAGDVHQIIRLQNNQFRTDDTVFRDRTYQVEPGMAVQQGTQVNERAGTSRRGIVYFQYISPAGVGVGGDIVFVPVVCYYPQAVRTVGERTGRVSVSGGQRVQAVRGRTTVEKGKKAGQRFQIGEECRG